MLDYRLRPGTRVRVLGNPIQVTLRANTGKIVRQEEGAEGGGYFLVQLDEPAVYHWADGREEDLREILEHGDNLIVIEVSK